MPIVNNAIRRIYFRVGREGLARAMKGLIPSHSHPTYHTHHLSPTIMKYTHINTFQYSYSTFCTWLVTRCYILLLSMANCLPSSLSLSTIHDLLPCLNIQLFHLSPGCLLTHCLPIKLYIGGLISCKQLVKKSL